MVTAKTSTNITKTLERQHPTARVIYVSSYIPRKCGIATFTKDLTNAVNVINPYGLAEILAVTDPAGGNGYEYPWEVKYRIHQEDEKEFIAAADYINSSSAEIVCLQHEFGLFGGRDGAYIIEFLKRVNKKVVTTLHTVPEKPTEGQKKIVQQIFKYSDAVVVMIEPVLDRLVKVYKVPERKVAVIHHGVPDIPFGGTEHFKSITGLSGKKVMTAINLIASNKGFEYAIRALPEVVQKFPNFVFLIIGETHPTVKKKEGEKYRESLEKLVKELKLSKHVQFINSYVTLEELVNYLRATDIYITPYLDPQQIASGTLSYAVGAGKVCISTPYLYAKEVINGNRGILVPFQSSNEITEAIMQVLSDNNYKQALEQESYRYGRFMTWSAVALDYFDLFNFVLRRR